MNVSRNWESQALRVRVVGHGRRVENLEDNAPVGTIPEALPHHRVCLHLTQALDFDPPEARASDREVLVEHGRREKPVENVGDVRVRGPADFELLEVHERPENRPPGVDGCAGVVPGDGEVCERRSPEALDEIGETLRHERIPVGVI